MGNAGARGYYRAAVSPAMVRTMAEKVDTLSPAERMAVLSDEWALVRAGRHDVGTFMDLASGFAGERTADGHADAGDAASRRSAKSSRPTARAARIAPGCGKLLAPALREVGAARHARRTTTNARRCARRVVGHRRRHRARPASCSRRRASSSSRSSTSRARSSRRCSTLLVNLAALRRRCRALRSLSRAQQGGDDPGSPLSVSVRADGLHRSGARAPHHGSDALERGALAGCEARDRAHARQSATPSDLAWQLVRERWNEIQKKTGEFVGNTVIVGALVVVLRRGDRRRNQGVLRDAQGARRRAHAAAVARADRQLCARRRGPGAEAGGVAEGAWTLSATPKLQLPNPKGIVRQLGQAPRPLVSLTQLVRTDSFGAWELELGI